MRFFIERLRVDFASKVLGLRINEWVSAIIFLIAVSFLVRPTGVADPDPDSDADAGADQVVAKPAQ